MEFRFEVELAFGLLVCELDEGPGADEVVVVVLLAFVKESVGFVFVFVVEEGVVEAAARGVVEVVAVG